MRQVLFKNLIRNNSYQTQGSGYVKSTRSYASFWPWIESRINS